MKPQTGEITFFIFQHYYQVIISIYLTHSLKAKYYFKNSVNSAEIVITNWIIINTKRHRLVLWLPIALIVKNEINENKSKISKNEKNKFKKIKLKLKLKWNQKKKKIEKAHSRPKLLLRKN